MRFLARDNYYDSWSIAVIVSIQYLMVLGDRSQISFDLELRLLYEMLIRNLFEIRVKILKLKTRDKSSISPRYFYMYIYIYMRKNVDRRSKKSVVLFLSIRNTIWRF